jgi:hypothetical protein
MAEAAEVGVEEVAEARPERPVVPPAERPEQLAVPQVEWPEQQVVRSAERPEPQAEWPEQQGVPPAERPPHPVVAQMERPERGQPAAGVIRVHCRRKKPFRGARSQCVRPAVIKRWKVRRSA